MIRTFLVALAVMLASGPAEAKLEGKTVKLGAIYSITGKGAEWGEHSKVATQIAVEEINAAGGVGGVPVEVVISDTGTEVGQAITLARKLILEDKVLAVLGPCFSSEFEALAPQLARLKTIILSQCSAKPGLSALSEWAFRNTLTSDKQLDPATRIWKEQYKIKTAAILYDSADAVSAAEGAKVLPALFKKYGVEPKGEALTYQTKDIDFSAQLTKIKAENPDGIALGACYQQAANIVRQARKLGLKQPFLAGACTGSPEFAELVGKDGEGSIIGSAGWPDDPRPKVQAFIKKFVERAGKKPNYGGMRAYDNVYMVKTVIEKGGVTNKPADLDADRDRIRKALAQLKDFDGIVGMTSFDEHRDGSGKATVLAVKDGKFVRVDY